MVKEPLQIRDLTPGDEPAARALILTGLEEHWGWLDPTLNPDVYQLWQHYQSETFLLAWRDGILVGTGALIGEAPGVGRVVRMSVAQDARRSGVGRRLLSALIERARARGLHGVVLETTATWTEARRFYEQAGFAFVEERDGDAHYRLRL